MNCKMSKLFVKYEISLANRWTLWYVYTLSHREKKKMGKKGRFNEYVLHEVFSFGTVIHFTTNISNI